MEFLGNFFKKVKDHFVPSRRNVYRPHTLRRPWLIFFLTVVLTAEGVFIADLLARQSALTFIAAVLPGEVIALTNDERSANSVGQLTENAQLDAAAQAKAADMAAMGYFSHVGPDGKQPWSWITGAGYSYQDAGENLAVRFVDSSDVVNAWMASPTHRANIVKPVYTEIGVGVAQGMYQGQPATFVVQYFGTPRGSVAVNQETGSAVASQQEVGATAASLQDLRGRSATIAPTSKTAATTTPAPSAQVAGAETAAPAAPTSGTNVTPTSVTQPQPQTPWNSFARELARGEVRPGGTIAWVLGGIATFLVLVLALTFFVHIQVQPTDMLVGGAVIAVIAISLIALNGKTPFEAGKDTSQAAAVFGALPTGGGFIDSVAASATQ